MSPTSAVMVIVVPFTTSLSALVNVTGECWANTTDEVKRASVRKGKAYIHFMIVQELLSFRTKISPVDRQKDP